MDVDDRLKISLLSLHGLIRVHEPELGRDADTGGQIRYVLELAAELARHPRVREVELITRQILDSRVDECYAQLEEQLAPNAKLIRIPFGPRRYLRKESLWPFLEMFIDQTLIHFRRHGLPDVIHGHYADAGLAGAQLARLLHIPYVFTGHSLGRVKKLRLSQGRTSPDKLERKYKFRTRVEGEETALETAALVVTSTNQEVEQQYAMYHHYQPDRMEVIPPGVDLSEFRPPGEQDGEPPIAAEIHRFLRDPAKPIILTMARPDERKNLETLVRVYGESAELQERANLVLVLGTRGDLRELPKSQRTIITHILYLIDLHNLYGRVAYPKTHQPSDVPDLYRLATISRGVFVNPALTEPFGLTLLEAAASGLPVVATNDGGPRDIIANCKNGLLVDPLDLPSIEKALLRCLTEPDQWDTWSAGGLTGAQEHYTWKKHVERYVRDISEIVSHADQPAVMEGPRIRRIPRFDRLIITDLDNTLTGDDEALHEFLELLKQNDHVGFGIATGRTLASAQQLIAELNLPRPDVLITGAGTQLHYGETLTPDLSWQKQIGDAWQPDQVRELLEQLPGVFPQPPENQSEYKVSFEIDLTQSPSISALKRQLREAGLRAKVVLSHSMYLDVLPVRGGSDLSLRHVLWKWGFSPEHVLVAGDSGNDAGMLLGRTLGVVVGNYSSELERLKRRPRIYFAQGRNARGILEGIDYYQFLSNIVIPNDRIE